MSNASGAELRGECIAQAHLLCFGNLHHGDRELDSRFAAESGEGEARKAGLNIQSLSKLLELAKPIEHCSMAELCAE